MDFSKLNDEQYEAVQTTEGPVVIIAGAGSGKTTTLTYRLANLIDKGVNPDEILLLTFTNKAANEMTERANILLGDKSSTLKGCTYHSFCSELLRKYAGHLGYKSNFTICDEPDSVEILNLIKEKLGYTKDDCLPTGKDLSNMLNYIVNKEQTLKYVLENRYYEYLFKEVYIEEIFDTYKEYKKEKNILDYNDLLILVNQLFEEHSAICKQLSNQYKYIMVDEFQDSNTLQMKLITKLRSFDNKNICVVGDPDQSIYNFRGANYDNIINFPDVFEDTKIIKLNQNYRSNQEILDLTNQILSADGMFRNELKGTHHIGYKPKVLKLNAQSSEAEYIVSKIKRYYNEGVKLKDMAILMRNSNDSNMIEAILTEQTSFRYEKFGGIKFLERDFVKNIFAYLKITINIEDEISWFRILKLYPNIGSVNAKKITEKILENGLDELKSDSYKTKKFKEYLDEIYDFFTKIQEMPLLEQLDEIINTYYYKVSKRSLKESKIKEDTKKKKLKELDINIEQAQVLLELAKDYKKAEKFLNDLTLEASVSTPEDDYLTISTIHSAKGLEFEVVFVINCVDGVFPWDKKPEVKTADAMKEYEESLKEEKRVFYVAITRAKKDLYITVPEYNIFRRDYNQISRFLTKDILSKYCDVSKIY